MKQHAFIFNLGNWVGDGKITVNVLEEALFFTTEWTVQAKDLAGKASCIQEIQISGIQESLRNDLIFYNFGDHEFCVDMENENVGRIVGVGFYDERRISWEFRNNGKDFEGFETYTLQSDGSYHMRGEYVTSEQIRTKIESKIRLRANPVGLTDEFQEEGPF
jgi:hypothetical protein